MLQVTSHDRTLLTRIEILQGQIDRATESGRTHNAMGVPMPKQIQSWEQLIVKAQKQLSIKRTA